MSENLDLDRFVKDPSLLIELCRKVIDKIDLGPDNAKIIEKEAQLREIARTIDRLEKVGVAVPKALRGEKMRLAAELGIKAETSQALSLIGEEFESILKDLKARQGRRMSHSGRRNLQGKRSHLPKTKQRVFREYIVLALKKFGGRARAAEVNQEIRRQLSDKLLPGDFDILKDGRTLSWQSSAGWERLQMVKDGVLKSDSPAGIWELADDHR